MKEQIKKFLNEEQDPKAVEKITNKLNDLLMKNEEIGYIGVQKNPVLTVFPDSIVLTNKRIILCKPKNLGLSMDFSDYTWEDITASFVKEGILGSEFSFTTTTDLTISIDYIPKTQARKIYTFAKEQLDILKNGPMSNATEPVAVTPEPVAVTAEPEIEEAETEEVTNYAELIPQAQPSYIEETPATPAPAPTAATDDKGLASLSKEELFDKLQSYKKLLDNGLILQGEYDQLKKEIITLL